jgi:hypothetical protein
LLGVDRHRAALEGLYFPLGSAYAPRELTPGQVSENPSPPKPAADLNADRIEQNRIAWLTERRSNSQLAFHATHAHNLLDANA